LENAAKAAERKLKTADAELRPLETSENLLWPPVLQEHDKWRVDALEGACGRAKRVASYTDEKHNDVGGVDYAGAAGNLVHFEFGPNGVAITYADYADPKHVANPNLIGSLNSMSCLSAVK
jgi:hypothetical protein